MIPLAERMRPLSIENYIGQQHLMGNGAVLRQSIEKDTLPSIIFWGPPGVGKTSLANLIANTLNRPFFSLSAIHAGVKDIREVIEKAKANRFFDAPSPILFIDEIHRFSKSQQDSLLGAVEKGVVTLIGATTENPSFEVISALLSRCQVYVLEVLSVDDLKLMLQNALSQDEFLKNKKIRIAEFDAIIQLSGGDGRKLYNILELVTNFYEAGNELVITNELVFEKVKQNIAFYDKGGEQHYDIISAFIKSMRGSDPNVALYWMARMLDGGEDIEFIARRMMILAAEDIGLANPNALLMANTCMQAIKVIGMPESRIILSQTVVYLATSAKSNATYMAIENAMKLANETSRLPVPLHLRNAPTKLMKQLDYGKDYAYAHNYENNFVNLEFLPEKLSGTKLYEPAKNAQEEQIRNRLKLLWQDKYGY